MFKRDDSLDGRLRPRSLIHPASGLGPPIFLNVYNGWDPITIQIGDDQIPYGVIPQDLPWTRRMRIWHKTSISTNKYEYICPVETGDEEMAMLLTFKVKQIG